MDIIFKYFNSLSDVQAEQFSKLGTLYPEWNEKINVISRKDIGNLYTNHILHSLGIAKFYNFQPGTCVLDFGTGGGFPGIPLAILFPEVHFHLVDRIGKKLKVVQDIIEQLDLKTVTVQHGDIKEVKHKFDYVVCRAVIPLKKMEQLIRKIKKK